MGTHPIFESDFDCLTDFQMRCLEGRSITELLYNIHSVDNRYGEWNSYPLR